MKEIDQVPKRQRVHPTLGTADCESDVITITSPDPKITIAHVERNKEE